MRLPPEIRGDAEFFRVFARFEHALKKAGYLIRVRDRDRRARVEWKCLYQRPEIRDLLEKSRNDRDIKILIEEPPQEQVNEGGRAVFEDKDRPSDTKQLLIAAKRVRNNLFHGAKGTAEERARDELLIRASRKVIAKVLDRCPDLAKKFDSD